MFCDPFANGVRIKINHLGLCFGGPYSVRWSINGKNL